MTPETRIRNNLTRFIREHGREDFSAAESLRQSIENDFGVTMEPKAYWDAIEAQHQWQLVQDGEHPDLVVNGSRSVDNSWELSAFWEQEVHDCLTRAMRTTTKDANVAGIVIPAMLAIPFLAYAFGWFQ